MLCGIKINTAAYVYGVSNDINYPCARTHVPVHDNYNKITDMRRTKSKNLNDSHLVLKSSLPNPLKPGVKPRMKM